MEPLIPTWLKIVTLLIGVPLGWWVIGLLLREMGAYGRPKRKDWRKR
jgi:hypothetical protein